MPRESGGGATGHRPLRSAGPAGEPAPREPGVSHYDVRLRYYPGEDRLTGTTTILAVATQDLSSFHLDFVLDVASVKVNNRAATFTREGDHELVVTPPRAVGRARR